jgi:pyridoxamine 5'-phosphate oxidase
MINLSDIRKNYDNGFKLSKQEVSPDPFVQFSFWLKNAIKSESPDANAMILSSVDNNQQPFSRTVLLKHYDKGKFTFFTNFKSNKSLQIQNNPKVSLLFYWKNLLRQIHITGTAVKSPDDLSNSYFSSRPRESQIGAWASQQSSVIASRQELEKKFQQQKDRFKTTKEIPRPEFWGGITVTAKSYEFWQGRSNRLHDRISYQLSPTGKITLHRLSP